jgi:hypothetical protein
MKASEQGTRVVLVKPGDVLVIGNLGPGFLPELLSEATMKMKAATGIEILACYQDVTIGQMPGKFARLLGWLREQARGDELNTHDHPKRQVYAEVAKRLEEAMVE